MDDQRSAPPRIGDNLAWVSLFVAVVSALFVLARTLEIAGCSGQCEYPTLETVTRGFWMTDLIVFALTTVAYLSQDLDSVRRGSSRQPVSPSH